MTQVAASGSQKRRIERWECLEEVNGASVDGAELRRAAGAAQGDGASRPPPRRAVALRIREALDASRPSRQLCGVSTRVLVTGGCGFIGDHVVRLLRRRGDRVRVLDLAAPEEPRPGVEYLRGDITDRAAVREAMEGVDVLYHLAARAGLWAPDPSEFERVNRAGSRNVFEEAERARVERAVHCSTEAVMKGRTPPPPGTVMDEERRLPKEEMLGPYAVGKWVAEDEALAAAGRGLHVVVVNPTVPVGPGDRNLTPPTRMLLGYLNGRFPAYLDSLYNLVDVRDVAEGHLRAGERGRPGERYLLAHRNVRMSEILKLLARITGLSMPRVRIPYAVAWTTAVIELGLSRLTGRPPAAPLTGLRIVRDPVEFTNRKAVEELGMEFRPLEESLTDAVSWLRERGLLERRPPRLDEVGAGAS